MSTLANLFKYFTTASLSIFPGNKLNQKGADLIAADIRAKYHHTATCTIAIELIDPIYSGNNILHLQSDIKLLFNRQIALGAHLGHAVLTLDFSKEFLTGIKLAIQLKDSHK